MSTRQASESMSSVRPQHDHMGLPTREEFVHGLASFGDKVMNVTSSCMDLQEMNNMVVGSNPMTSTSGFNVSSSAFDDSFNGMFNSKRNVSFQENAHLMSNGSREGRGGGEGLTRDFLGLRAFPHGDFVNMAGLEQLGSSSYSQQQQAQNQAQWHTN